MSDPGCGRVDPDQEKRWAKHKTECLARLKEMNRAQVEARRICKIADLEGRRASIAILETKKGRKFVDMVKGFLLAEWSNGRET